MNPLQHDPWFTFRPGAGRIVRWFQLDGVAPDRLESVFKVDANTGDRLALLATGIVGQGGWVELGQPHIMMAGEAFSAVPDSE